MTNFVDIVLETLPLHLKNFQLMHEPQVNQKSQPCKQAPETKNI